MRVLVTEDDEVLAAAVAAGLSLTPANGAKIRRRIAIVPESPDLYQRLSVRENLECFVDLYGTPDLRPRTRGIADALAS